MRNFKRVALAAISTASVVGLLGSSQAYAQAESVNGGVSHRLEYSATQSPVDSRGSLAQSAPTEVKKWLAGIRDRGGINLSVTQAPYSAVASSGRQSTVHPDAFPSGCGLYVAVYKSGDYIVSSSLTSCTMVTSEIEMHGGLARQHWYGWETLDEETKDNFASTSLSLTINGYCKNSGSFVYAGTTNGELIMHGTSYTATAYDNITSTRC